MTVSPNEETVWLNQEQLAILFNVNVPAINKNIKNIILEKELDENSTISKMEIVRLEGNRKVKRNINFYNLDMIISVGYRVNSKEGIAFRKWANMILKQYLLKGYVINDSRVQITNDNFLELTNIVNTIANTQQGLIDRVENIEQKLESNIYNPKQVFVNGEYFDAYTFIQDLFQKANTEIIIIDNYTDRSILERLSVKQNNVKVEVYTHPSHSKIIGPDINKFNKQYGNLSVSYTMKAHDRFIIIDNTYLYHVGASLKDLGNKLFAIEKLDNSFISLIINNL